MSRSRRHTPIFGHTIAQSDRPWKRLWHRAYRSRTRQQVRQGQEPLRIGEHEMSNAYNANKDGKHWYGHCWNRHSHFSLQRLGSVEAYRIWWAQEFARIMRK